MFISLIHVNLPERQRDNFSNSKRTKLKITPAIFSKSDGKQNILCEKGS